MRFIIDRQASEAPPRGAVQAHMPTLLIQQPVDAPVAIPAILAGQINDGLGQGILVSPALGKLALCRSRAFLWLIESELGFPNQV